MFSLYYFFVNSGYKPVFIHIRSHRHTDSEDKYGRVSVGELRFIQRRKHIIHSFLNSRIIFSLKLSDKCKCLRCSCRWPAFFPIKPVCCSNKQQKWQTERCKRRLIFSKKESFPSSFLQISCVAFLQVIIMLFSVPLRINPILFETATQLQFCPVY